MSNIRPSNLPIEETDLIGFVHTDRGVAGSAKFDLANVSSALNLDGMATQAPSAVAITGGTINGTSIGATTPTTGVFSALTVNDNSTLGSSNSDTVNFNARVASDINPATDNTYDLGVTGHEWRNLNIDGTANIDSLVADTADINGGTIDATTIGAGTPSTGAFTTLTTSGTIVNSQGSFDALTFTGSSSNSIGFRIQNAHTGANNWNVFVSGGGPAPVGSFGIYDDTGSVTRMTIAKTTGSTVFSGGINSTAIGATTPSTGAFTTLSASAKFTAGSSSFVAGDGSIYVGGATGLTIIGKAGSSDDVTIAAANGQNLLTNATGTSNVVIGNIVGTISAANSLAVTGALSSTGVISTANNTAYSFKDSGGTLRRGVLMDSANDIYMGAVDNAITSNLYLTAGGAGGVVRQQVNGSTITATSTTGLAVTGALSSTGITSVAGGQYFSAGTSGVAAPSFNTRSAGLKYNLYDQISATTMPFGLGIDSGAMWLAVGSTADVIKHYVGTTLITTTSSTGLAVTGALSSTGALAIGNTVNTVSPTSPNRTITMVIGGTTYYIHAKTTND